MDNQIALRAPQAIDREAFEPRSWGEVIPIAEALCKSGMLPAAIKSTHAAIAIIITGRELGLSIMQSFRAIHVIDGKPTISAQLMQALVLQSGLAEYVRCSETTPLAATYETRRRGNPTPERIRWTMEDAVRAQLAAKQNWQRYPAAMLRARACAELMRAVYPEVMLGIYDPDELAGGRREHEDIATSDVIVDSIPPTPEAAGVDLPTQPPEAPEDLEPLRAELAAAWAELEAAVGGKEAAKRIARKVGFSMRGTTTRKALLERQASLTLMLRGAEPDTQTLLEAKLSELEQLVGEHRAGELVQKHGIMVRGAVSDGAMRARLALATELLDAELARSAAEPGPDVEL